MKIEPLSDNILIEPIKEEDKTESGIILQKTTEEERPRQGKVISVGRDIKEIKKGDVILLLKYGPSEVEIENKTYLIAKEEDILAIIK